MFTYWCMLWHGQGIQDVDIMLILTTTVTTYMCASVKRLAFADNCDTKWTAVTMPVKDIALPSVFTEQSMPLLAAIATGSTQNA